MEIHRALVEEVCSSDGSIRSVQLVAGCETDWAYLDTLWGSSRFPASSGRRYYGPEGPTSLRDSPWSQYAQSVKGGNKQGMFLLAGTHCEFGMDATTRLSYLVASLAALSCLSFSTHPADVVAIGLSRPHLPRVPRRPEFRPCGPAHTFRFLITTPPSTDALLSVQIPQNAAEMSHSKGRACWGAGGRTELQSCEGARLHSTARLAIAYWLNAQSITAHHHTH